MENEITKEQILNCIAEFENAACDYPFENNADITILRRRDNGKWFAAHFLVPCRAFEDKEGREFALNVKCDPPLVQMLIQTFAGAAPAYHMNKTHWVSLRLNGSMPIAEIEKLLRLAYDLTAPKARKTVKKK